MRLTVPPTSTLLQIYAALLLRYYTYTHLAFCAREYEVDRAAEVAFGGLRCQYVYFCTSKASKPSTFGVHSYIHSHGVCSIRQRTLAYVSVRQHTSAWQHTSAYVSIRTFGVLSDIHSHGVCELQVLQRQRSLNRLAHTSAYVRIHQHTSAYVSIRQHTSAYLQTSAPSQSPGVHQILLHVYEVK
jgi:hypothetical protein